MQLSIVAAGFTPGEADQLRRAMAAWKRKGGLEKYKQKLIDGMRKKGYSEEFGNRLYQQIQGFGEYGFPESHAASFALLAYDSAWLKRYEPAAFLAALLNSQPMGFYAPSQLVQDARRHGVEVRPVDVSESHWDCTLERGGNTEPVVRLGLLMIKGLSRSGADRIVEARNDHSFESIHDLAHRAALNQHDLQCLSRAGALNSLSSHRRLAYWQVAGIHTGPHLLRTAPTAESLPRLSTPTEPENLMADYASLGLTLGRHPLALLRPYLATQSNLTAAQLRTHPNGSPARVTGIVIGRQRPGTASGVIFVTLEDESGYINAVIWPRLFARQRRELLESRLLTIFGTVECKDGIVHLIGKRLVDSTNLLGSLITMSRDFH
jgi:error-prone DNA polymerase